MTATAPSTTIPIETLLTRWRERGDPEALAAVFDATAPKLFRVAVRFTGDAAAAEDALQETFLAVMETANGYDAARPAWPWLVGILRRKLADSHRRARRVVDPLRLEPKLLADDPADAAERREQIDRVRKSLDDLPEPYRGVALMRWQFGLEPAEIAHVRGEPPGTVRSLLSRAVERIRRNLGGLAALVPWTRPARGLDAVRRLVVAKAHGTTALGAAVAGGIVMTKAGVAVIALVVGLAAGVALDRGLRPEPRTDAQTAAASAAAGPQTGTPARRERVRAEPSREDATPSSAATTAATASEEASRDDAVRVEVLRILAGLDGNWKRAAAAAESLTKLDGRVVLATLRERWKLIPEASDRQQLLKVFSAAGDPRVLDVLDLGMNDSDAAVQNWASGYLASYAGREFASDWKSYAPWRAKTAGQDLATVVRGTVGELVPRLRTASPGELHALIPLLDRVSGAARAEDLRQAGLPDAAEPWITRVEDMNDLGLLLLAIARAQPAEEYLRRNLVPLFASEEPGRRTVAYQYFIIGMGSRRNAWAVDPIVAHLRDKDVGSVRDAARALGWIGDPRAIEPLLESLRGAGNASVNAALSQITGVRYDDSHDAAWWDDWWAKNRERFQTPR